MAHLMLVNPRKRRKSSKARRKSPARRTGIVARARRSASVAVRSIRRKYRRNPIPKVNLVNDFKNGAIGAGGALAVDVLMMKLPIPANLKTGQLAPIVKGLVGIGVGMAVAHFGKNRELGKQLAAGAVTVALYNAGKTMLGTSLGLSGYDMEWGNNGLLGADDYNDFSAYNLGAYTMPSSGGYVTGAAMAYQ